MTELEKSIRHLRRDGWSFYRIGRELRIPWQRVAAIHRRLVDREEAALVASIREREAKP